MAGSSGRSGLRPATPRSFPMEREGSTRATSSNGSPSGGCKYSGRRSLRPACSSTTSGSRSGRHHAQVFHQVRRGDRMVTVNGLPSSDPSWNEHFTKATPAQTRALAWIEKFVENPARLASDESVGEPPDPGVRAGSLRGRVRSELSRYLEAAISSRQGARPVQVAQAPRVPGHDDGEGTGTPEAFVEAGFSPRENHAFVIDFGFPAGTRRPSDFHMSPALPDKIRC